MGIILKCHCLNRNVINHSSNNGSNSSNLKAFPYILLRAAPLCHLSGVLYSRKDRCSIVLQTHRRFRLIHRHTQASPARMPTTSSLGAQGSASCCTSHVPWAPAPPEPLGPHPTPTPRSAQPPLILCTRPPAWRCPSHNTRLQAMGLFPATLVTLLCPAPPSVPGAGWAERARTPAPPWVLYLQPSLSKERSPPNP